MHLGFALFTMQEKAVFVLIMGKTTSSKWMKSVNQQKVLRLIYTEGPISRVELAEKTGLTQQTITNIVKRLIDDDILMETSPVSSNGGRKPIPLVVKSKQLYAVGIEIAVKYIRGSLLDFENNLLMEVTEEVPVYKDEYHPLEYIDKVISRLLQAVPEPSKLQGIGCSIQALVDSERGVIIYSPGLRWRNFPLGEKLSRKYDVPIYLENDVNLLALVENLKGSLAQSQHNVTVKFDYGIGGAIVTNKQLNAGAGFTAGEFGHYKAFRGERALRCHCGTSGCLTTLASISGLARNAGYELEQFHQMLLDQDSEAEALFGTITDAIVEALGNVITLVNPDHVLLTGKWIDQMKEIAFPLIQERLYDMLPSFSRDVKLIMLPETPDESVSAAGLVMNHFFEVPIHL